MVAAEPMESLFQTDPAVLSQLELGHVASPSTSNNQAIAVSRSGTIAGEGGGGDGPSPTDCGAVGATLDGFRWCCSSSTTLGSSSTPGGALFMGLGESPPAAKPHMRSILSNSETSVILEINKTINV